MGVLSEELRTCASPLTKLMCKGGFLGVTSKLKCIAQENKLKACLSGYEGLYSTMGQIGVCSESTEWYKDE